MEWNLSDRRFPAETPEHLQNQIADRIYVLREDEEAPLGARVAQHWLMAEELEGAVADVNALAALCRDTSLTDPDQLAWRQTLLDDMAKQFMESSDENGLEIGWWLHGSLEQKRPRLPHNILQYWPSEQFIIGQAGRGIRFFNFGQPLTAPQVHELQLFVDEANQWLGERLYDDLTDVVFAPIDQHCADAHKNMEMHGYTEAHLPGVFFVDSNILLDAWQHHQKALKVSWLRQVLHHELEHLGHGESNQQIAALEEFAARIGWDVAGANAARAKGLIDLSAYAPANDYMVQLPDKSYVRMTAAQYKAAFPGENLRRYALGSPTLYGNKNFCEAYAETGTQIRLGDLVARQMPETRDAYLEHFQQRLLRPGETAADRPIATPLNRPPIVVERRTGNSIIYPSTTLPDTIYIRPYLLTPEDAEKLTA